jgi:steroid delta-isomerase-like uncharacterized protein
MKGEHPMSERNKDLFRRLVDVLWNQGDLDASSEFFADDAVIYGMPADFPQGIEGAKASIGWFRAAFPDLHLTNNDLIAEGDKVVQRWTMTGTHKGEFMGIAPTGKKFTTTGISIVRIANGKIVEAWNASDQLDLMQQLGAIPS